MKLHKVSLTFLLVLLVNVAASSLVLAKGKKDDKEDKSKCLEKSSPSKKCLEDNGYKCEVSSINSLTCTKKGEDDYTCDRSKHGNCTDDLFLRQPEDNKSPETGPVAPAGDPDLIIDSIQVSGDIVTRPNGFTYVPLEIHIANAGSAGTGNPFYIGSGYYDYKDDVAPASYTVPDLVTENIPAGSVLIKFIDVAIPDSDGIESPFVISIHLDHCNHDDDVMDTNICRIYEEHEYNNTAEVDL